MTPSTRALVDYLRDDGRTDDPEVDMVADDPEDSQRIWALQLKRKRHQMMLKQMLENSGHSDLAKMVNIRRETVEMPEDDADV